MNSNGELSASRNVINLYILRIRTLPGKKSKKKKRKKFLYI